MFTDIHHHILYGMDDGAQNFEMSQKMLLRAQKDRIDKIIATPHMTPGHERFDWEKYHAHLEICNAWCEENGVNVRLYPGAEILYTQETPYMAQRDELPTMLGKSSVVLVEFSPMDPYKTLLEAATKLGNYGYSVIFAHIERYGCLRRKGRIEELRNNYYVSMQMNADTIIDKQGFFEDRWIDRVLRSELIDYVGTDSHNLTTRRCRMSLCYKTLCDQYGRDLARWLCFQHANELMEKVQF